MAQQNLFQCSVSRLCSRLCSRQLESPLVVCVWEGRFLVADTGSGRLLMEDQILLGMTLVA